MKRCSALMCMPIGVSLFLMPTNATSVVLGGVVTGFLLVLRMLPAFLGMLLVRYGYSMFVRGIKKLLFRNILLLMFRIVLMVVPMTTNARVRVKKKRYLEQAKARLLRLRGADYVVGGLVFLTAAAGTYTVILLLGTMRLLFLLLEPVLNIAARLLVGSVIEAWWNAMTSFLRTHVKEPYVRTRTAYYRHNRKLLKQTTETYREIVHKRPKRSG